MYVTNMLKRHVVMLRLIVEKNEYLTEIVTSRLSTICAFNFLTFSIAKPSPIICRELGFYCHSSALPPTRLHLM